MGFFEGFEKAASGEDDGLVTKDKTRRFVGSALVGGGLGSSIGAVAANFPANGKKVLVKDVNRGGLRGLALGTAVGAAGGAGWNYLANRKRNPVGPKETGEKNASREVSTKNKAKRVGAGALAGGVLGGAVGSLAGGASGSIGESVRTSPTTHKQILKVLPSRESKKLLNEVAKSRNLPKAILGGMGRGALGGAALGSVGFGTAAYLANRKRNPVGPKETGEIVV